MWTSSACSFQITFRGRSDGHIPGALEIHWVPVQQEPVGRTTHIVVPKSPKNSAWAWVGAQARDRPEHARLRNHCPIRKWLHPAGGHPWNCVSGNLRTFLRAPRRRVHHQTVCLRRNALSMAEAHFRWQAPSPAAARTAAAKTQAALPLNRFGALEGVHRCSGSSRVGRPVLRQERSPPVQPLGLPIQGRLDVIVGDPGRSWRIEPIQRPLRARSPQR